VEAPRGEEDEEDGEAQREEVSPRELAEAVRDRMLRDERMSWQEVASWARSGDIELMGAAYDALMSTTGIEGNVDGPEAERFLVTYLLAAIEGKMERAEVFVIQPYIAAHELVHLYRHWRGRSPRPADQLRTIREALARLYLAGGEQQRRRVVDGFLEHVFEEPACRPDFDGWKSDAQLAVAVEEAMEWARERPSAKRGQ
jgi:hypothetical protein